MRKASQVWSRVSLSLILGFGMVIGVVTGQDFPGAGKVTKVHGGFKFTEGPATNGKHLYFTDIPNDRIMRTDLKGNLEIFMEACGHCNGLMFDGNGKLIGCRMDGELISIDTETKQVKSLSSKYKDVRFNACNDLVIDKIGGIYFTDPRYSAPEPWPQGKEAFYYRSNKGEVTRLGDDIAAPNGIILSPDESTLYVVPSMQKQVFAYTVKSPGVIEGKRVLYEIKQPAMKENSGRRRTIDRCARESLCDDRLGNSNRFTARETAWHHFDSRATGQLFLWRQRDEDIVCHI